MKIYKDDGSIYKFKPESLYLGRKKINKINSKKNLELISCFLNKLEIKYVLGYGTLLGAIRDKDFINHDEDIDLCLKIDYFKIFINNLDELDKTGFKVVRFDERGFLSIMLNNDYIDLYFFSNINDQYCECCGNFLLSDFFNNTIEIDFLGNKYSIPKEYEKWFLLEYGETWNIPIEYKQNIIKEKIQITKTYLKNILPKLLCQLYYKKQSKLKYAKFIERINKYKNK